MPLQMPGRINITVTQAGTQAQLPVCQIPQQQTEQCWAACVDMVLDFLQEPNVRQCEIADNAPPITSGCCNAPSSSLCNRPLSDDQISRLWEAYRIRPRYNAYPVPFDVIQEEIGKGRPVEVGIVFSVAGPLGGPRGHVVLVRGWSQNADGQYVFVNDPASDMGYGQVLFSTLLNGYGGGKWESTWAMLTR